MQSAKLILTLLAVIALDICLSQAYTLETCKKTFKVNYSMLVLQWSPGVCLTGNLNCKRNYKAAFAIHGLWPQESESKSPTECCNDQKFNMKKLNSLKAELKTHWPSLTHMEDEGFWQYEWNKHGTCAIKVDKIDSLYQYFQFAVKTTKKLNPEDVLASKGIKPHSKATILGSRIVNALSDAYGSRVRINCAQSKNGKAMVMTELSICFDNKLQLTDCRQTSSKCMGNILYPALN